MENTNDLNENTEYEKLAQSIYQSILKAERFENINVDHDINVKGKSGCEHQIDVYWEFTVGGVTQRVAIECKNYISHISVGRVRDFFGVLHDIGNINGILVTKKGYQSGAKKYADYYGINLKEIRFPEKDDWSGRLKTIQVNIHVLPVNIKQRTIELDFDWLKANKKIENPTDAFLLKISGMNQDIWIYDGSGQKMKNFFELEEGLPHEMKPGKDKVFSYEYDDAYIDSGKIGQVKIKRVEFKYDIDDISEKVLIEGEDITKAIIKDVKSGEIKFIRKDGSVK